jgi:small subunit ribosomal protein S20
MANKKSSKKRVRQTLVKTENNRKALSKVKTSARAAREALTTKGAKPAEAVKAAVSSLMKAGSKGLIHKRAAARRVSRLMKAANAQAAKK